MARKTWKPNTAIQQVPMDSQAKSNTETSEVNPVLVSVLRIFAARGRAIREAREKAEANKEQS